MSESTRLQALNAYHIMDTPPECAFDELVRMAANFLDVPIALVSLLDEKRQWFKARHGMLQTQTPRDIALCQEVVITGEMLVVPDARKDKRFANNPLVAGEFGLHAYAGAPLRTPEGEILGTLCVLDTTQPRAFSARELELLGVLATCVMAHLDTRRALYESQRARERLATMSLAKSSFLARTSHELRTPMTAIVGYAELLQEALVEGASSPGMMRDDLDAILASSQHIVSLLDDLLDLAKIEANELELRPQHFLVQELLDELEDHISPLLVASENRLVILPASQELTMVADRRRILQVLINLCINANKFTCHGQVLVRLQESDYEDMLVFSVEDSGCGIAPEQIDHLFEAFHQVSSTEEGVGLGLAICKQIVTLMGGHVHVTSQPGEGSCFDVHIPRMHALNPVD